MENKKKNKRRRLHILSALFLVCITVYCIKWWDVWFDNPVEPPYTHSNIPARIQLTPGNEGQFSRNVSWQCGDTLAPSYLLLVKTAPADLIDVSRSESEPAPGDLLTDPAETTVVSRSESEPAPDNLLTASTDTIKIAAEGKILHTQGGVTVIYHAKLINLPEGEYRYSVCSGNRQSDWYSFKVSAAYDFRFVYIGDIQDTIGRTKHKQFASVNRMGKGAAFWVFSGDIIDLPHDRYWNDYFVSMDTIAQTIPIIASPGNHEYLKGLSGKLDERFVHHFSYFTDSRSNGHAVFETHHGQLALITLDSNREPWTLFSQRRWLKKALQKAGDARWKIVVLHHPVRSVRGKNNHYFFRQLFDPLIHKYGVDIVLQGHDHRYARMITKDENRALTTPIYVISHFSPKNYQTDADVKYDLFGNNMRFYQIIDVVSDTLSLKTYTENDELFDHFRIIKSATGQQVTDLSIGLPEQIDSQPQFK